MISGLVAVALLNIYMFAGVETMDQAAKADVYGRLYLIALVIPLVSVSGIFLAWNLNRLKRAELARDGHSNLEIDELLVHHADTTEPNHWYFTGGLAFVVMALVLGLGNISYAKEIVFVGSMESLLG